ncbi:MAG TPA: MXAN_2562 family outer membrane beta-barrel protein [Kofleriaceae bacterium]|nr:MXAN_2562 family outer membrane beta-barrel protein [Kofleriaceae bacterium]
MRIGLASLSFALVAAATAGTGRADVPADSIKLTLRTPESVDVADSTDPEDYIQPTDVQKPREFNFARCVCDEGADTFNVQYEAAWANGAPMNSAGTQLFAWAGSSCATAASRGEREMTCSRLTGIADAVALDNAERLFVPVGELLTPGTNNTTCKEDLTQVTYGLYTSTDGEGTITKVVEEKIDVDMKAPPVPTELTVHGQEGQISLNWEALSSEAGDIQYFQALCAVADTGEAAHTKATHDAQYDTPYTLCGASLAQEIEAATYSEGNEAEQTGRDITEAELGDLALLDSAFICGQSGGSNSTGVTLEDLEDGVEYMVVLVSVDKAGNAKAVYVPKTVAPAPVTDFWEDLNGDEPGIDGGLCLVESTYGGGGGGLNGALRAWRDELRQTPIGRWMVDRYYAWGAPLASAARSSVVARVVLGLAMLPLVAVALVWHAIGLPAMLALVLAFVVFRRRRKWIAAAAIALAPSLAAAQGSNTPYWDDDLASESAEVSGPKWHFGLRLGPYLPSIDDERFDEMPGPYEKMFGDGSWMPALDLHRIWGTRFGQIGGGLSLAYFKKSADAFIPGSDDRAVGNENSLTIIPSELTAIWRGTMFHDNWGIPLIPYARGGLGYYLWWVRRPDGEYAKFCTSTPCDRAIGASLGLVGAAGLAIRAEGIDPDAARSMRDSGLDHAGFYAEVEMAWVDGFGNAKKLSLGDTTWSAGIDFEF